MINRTLWIEIVLFPFGESFFSFTLPCFTRHFCDSAAAMKLQQRQATRLRMREGHQPVLIATPQDLRDAYGHLELVLKEAEPSGMFGHFSWES